jgi:lipopolysaccharide/colanic/teichoic acid biosynthesis glycosyltransferase
VLPGITGWAQIHLAYDRCVDDVRRKLDYDLAYIARRSPLQDLRIMLRTVPVMLGRPVHPSSGAAAPRDRARASRGASPVSADPRQA